jgi:hypothetical protein
MSQPPIFSLSMIISPNQIITLRTSSRLLHYRVLKSFEPFTKAVVLLVQSREPDSLPLVLKIFDPRCLDERISPCPELIPSRPWTLTAERAAAETRAAVRRGDLEDTFDENLPFHDEPEDADPALIAALWEEYYFRLLQNNWKVEVAAYNRLKDVQGQSIPRLYHWGTYVPREPRAVEPYAIAIEYIPGPTLKHIQSNLLVPSLYEPILQLIDSLSDYGVLHSDLNWNNILFTPPRKPSRGVVIDFANGRVRHEQQSEEEWRKDVQFSSDSEHIRSVLKKRLIDVSLPEPPSVYRTDT